MTFSRASGPGGQNVNKRSTRATLRVSVADLPLPGAWRSRLRRAAGSLVTGDDELVISSEESRSQARNREQCFEKLRALLESTRRPPKPRIPTKPKRGAIERRLREKRQRSDRKRQRGGGDW